jgi:hypothetical protein
MNKLILITLASLMAGCANQLAKMSAGQIGVQEEAIKISNVDRAYGGLVTWVASGEGTKYVCTYDQVHVSCKEAKNQNLIIEDVID